MLYSEEIVSVLELPCCWDCVSYRIKIQMLAQTPGKLAIIRLDIHEYTSYETTKDLHEEIEVDVGLKNNMIELIGTEVC